MAGILEAEVILGADFCANVHDEDLVLPQQLLKSTPNLKELYKAGFILYCDFYNELMDQIFIKRILIFSAG